MVAAPSIFIELLQLRMPRAAVQMHRRFLISLGLLTAEPPPMTPEIATIKAGIFQDFAPYLSRRGVSFSALLAEAGLEAVDIADPAATLPLEKVLALLERAAEKTNDPCLGLHWAEAYPVGATGVFGYVLVNSKSVREAMQSAARYLGLFLHPADISFIIEDDLARLSWRLPATIKSSNVQYTLFSVAATMLRLRAVAGPAWQPFATDFVFRQLECEDELRRVLGPRVNFNMPANAIVVDKATLESQSGHADTRLYDLVRELGDRMLSEQSEASDIVSQTRTAIVDLLRSETVSLDAVAAAVEMPARTLQSRLTQAGTSFETVFQDTRKQMAIGYLRDTDMTLTDIAFLLGFSEQSAFTRAAQRWFDMPPSAYRQQERKDKGRARA